MFPTLAAYFKPTRSEELHALLDGCSQLLDDLRAISTAAPSEVSFLYVQDVTEEAANLLDDLRRIAG